MDYIVESFQVVAAFSSCKGGDTPFAIELNT